MSRHIALLTLPLMMIAATSFSAASKAENACRHFLPATGVVIQVACPTQTEAVAAKPAATSAAPEAKVINAVHTVAPAAKATAPAAKPAAVTKTSANGMKTCVEILERAQSGRLLGGDVEILRQGCGTR